MEEENIRKKIIDKMGKKFFSEESFIEKLKQYTRNPHYWIGYFHEEIKELHGDKRKYYVRRDSLYSKIEELKTETRQLPKEEVKQYVKSFVEKLEGIQPEDRNLIYHFFLGTLLLENFL